MAELLTGLSTQHDFPRVDLSEDNADLLELLMANVGIVDRSHQAIEAASWIFRLGHTTAMNSAARTIDDGERLAAVNTGIATFEAVTALVDGIARVSDITPVNYLAARLRHADSKELDDYIDTSLDSFNSDMPRTAEVIRSSSQRHFGYLTTYAVLGAALSRQFDLDCVA